MRQGGYAGTKLPPPPAPVHTRPSPRPVTTETRDSFSEVLCTQHATINDKGTLVLDGLPIILLGKILAFWSSRTLQNINFVVMWVRMYYCTLYMKRFLGCHNTLIAFIEFFYCQYCSSITPMLSTLLNLLSDLCINHWKTLQSQNEKISIFSISLGTQCRQSQWQCLG